MSAYQQNSQCDSRVPIRTGGICNRNELPIEVPQRVHFTNQIVLQMWLDKPEFDDAVLPGGLCACTTARAKGCDGLFALVLFETRKCANVGIIDTSNPMSRQAVMEAARSGIIPFCIADGRGGFAGASGQVPDAFESVMEDIANVKSQLPAETIIAVMSSLAHDIHTGALLRRFKWSNPSKPTRAHILLAPSQLELVTDLLDRVNG